MGVKLSRCESEDRLLHDAVALARQVEAAMMAATAFTARVESELLDDVETDAEPWLYSELQEFVVIGPR